MAHALAQTAQGQTAMAFVGDTPWHGLGQRLDPNASLDTWISQAGFDWQALTAAPQFIRADGTAGIMDDKRVIYRSDTGAPLSVMGAGYQIVQPRECMEFFRDLIETGGLQMHTAGMLDGGRRMWALCKNGHAGEIVKGDKVAQFLMIATSLDGTLATTATWTQIRVVCANTIAIALREAGDRVRAGKRGGKVTAVRVSHKSVFDAESVKAQMSLGAEHWAQFHADATRLAETPIDTAQARDILRVIFGMPITKKSAQQAAEQAAASATPAAVAGDSLAALLAAPYIPKVDPVLEAREDLARLLAKGDAREQKSVARTLALFAGEGRGASAEGVAGTAWGLLNAVTEHVDHEQGRSRDSALTSAWFGRGQEFKQSTLQALLAL